MKPEDHTIAQLRLSGFAIAEEKTAALEEFFRQLRASDDAVSRASPLELYESMWAILGIIGRSYQLMLCAIDQLADGNWNGFYVAARGLAETLCAVAWVNENQDRLPSLVRFEALRIGRIMNAGYRKYSQLQDIYARLSSISHPNRGSHLLGFRSPDERQDKGIWSPFCLTFSDHFANEMMELLLEIGPKIIRELDLLTRDLSIVRKGRLMAQIVQSTTLFLLGAAQRV
jgi:hypothetical protein